MVQNAKVEVRVVQKAIVCCGDIWVALALVGRWLDGSCGASMHNKQTGYKLQALRQLQVLREALWEGGGRRHLQD